MLFYITDTVCSESLLVFVWFHFYIISSFSHVANWHMRLEFQTVEVFDPLAQCFFDFSILCTIST